MTRTCNKCGFVADVSKFVKSNRYRFGYRPLCLRCSAMYLARTRIRKGEYKPRAYFDSTPNNTLDVSAIIPRTDLNQAIQILLEKGICRTKEEAREYAKW